TALIVQSTISTVSTLVTSTFRPSSTFSTLSTSREFLLRRSRKYHAQRGEKQAAGHHADRPFVEHRDQPERVRVVRRADDVAPEQDRIENAGQRAARDQSGAEQRARADLRL